MTTCYIGTNYAQVRMLVDNGLSEVFGSVIYESMAGCRKSLLGVSDEEREYAARFSSAGSPRLRAAISPATTRPAWHSSPG